MSDFGAPVAQDVTTPNFTQTLSGLMSLQKTQQDIQAQKLSMQGQASQNVSLAAKAGNDAQDRQEIQAYSQMFKSGKDDQGNDIMQTDANGNKTPNLAVVIPALGRIAPKNAQDLAQHLIQTEKDKVGLQTSAVGLDAANRQNLQGIVQSGVTNSSDDVNASIDQYVQQHPEAASTAAFIKSLTPNLDKAPDQQHRQMIVQSLASRLQPGSAVETQAKPAEVNAGNVQYQGVRAPAIAGGGFTGSTSITQGIAPGWSQTEDPVTHNKYMINQQTGESKSLTGMAANPNNAPPFRAPGQGESQVDMGKSDAARYSEISKEGVNANTGAQLADQVAQLADQVRTGKLTKEWADQLTILRQHDPSVTARQMLGKYAAQLKSTAESSASTDSSRDQISQGMPSPETMDPDAVKQAAQYVGGIFRTRDARQQYANQYVKNNGSPLGIQGADNAFSQAATPTVMAYRALSPGADRQQFLKDHGLTTPEKIHAFKAQINQVNHFNGGQ